MSQNLKRLQRIEAALAQLLQREKCYILWHHKVETEAEAIENAIRAGYFDPDRQEAVMIVSNIPRKGIYCGQDWTSELPAAPKHNEAYEITRTSPAPRFEGTYPDQPAEPKPERRYRIKYPDMGIV
jgi:hypothetical protein